MACKGHGARSEVPHHLAQRDHPLGAEDDVVAGERHHVEVDAKVLANNGDRGLTEDARACDAFAVGHGGGEAQAGLDGEPRARCSLLCDEVVRGAGVQQGSKRHRAHCHAHLHGVTNGHTSHC